MLECGCTCSKPGQGPPRVLLLLLLQAGKPREEEDEEEEEEEEEGLFRADAGGGHERRASGVRHLCGASTYVCLLLQVPRADRLHDRLFAPLLHKAGVEEEGFDIGLLLL